MARYFSQNVNERRHAAANLAFAVLAAAISALRHLLAQVEAGCAAVSLRQSGLRNRAVVDDFRSRELQPILKQPGASPRGLFDPLFAGLSADAAAIDAAICRRAHLR